MSTMWCLVKLTNRDVKEYELDTKALGQDLLNKVCEDIGVLETDFFSLVQIEQDHRHNKNEGHWLNLRNGLLRQLSGSPPYRLQLKVKFYVKPHFIQQLTTREFILDNLKQDIHEEVVRCTEEELVPFLGLVAQADVGSFRPRSLPALEQRYKQFLPPRYANDADILQRITEAHQQHKGLIKRKAVYNALKTASEWSTYGVEWHTVKSGDSGPMVHMCIGPENITVYDQDYALIKRIASTAVQKATHNGKSFYLHTTQDDGTTTAEMFKLPSHKTANALYRCVTEMHLFYLCDTVRNDVSSQFDRDIKGTLASLFSENKEMGKKYVFDIRRTLQEACDFNRRRIFAKEHLQERQEQRETQQQQQQFNEDSTESSLGASGSEATWQALCSDGEVGLSEDEEAEIWDDADEDEENVESDQEDDQPLGHSCTSPHCKVWRNNARHIADSLQCRVCMDAHIDTVFCPCGHVVCCTLCAQKLSNCPLCRTQVDSLQTVYLPNISLPDPSRQQKQQYQSEVVVSKHTAH